MQDFDKILGLTQDDKIKTNINMRDSIPANMKLAGTIRFLATGSKYANLQYQFWVHVSTLSRSIPEVWDAIYEKLKLIGHDVNWLSSSWWQSEYPDRQNLYSFFTVFRKKNMNYASHLFNNNGSIKKWHKFKREYNLHQNSYFQWVQLIDSIPEKWKFIIKKTMKLQLILSLMIII